MNLLQERGIEKCLTPFPAHHLTAPNDSQVIVYHETGDICGEASQGGRAEEMKWWVWMVSNTSTRPLICSRFHFLSWLFILKNNKALGHCFLICNLGTEFTSSRINKLSPGLRVIGRNRKESITLSSN